MNWLQKLANQPDKRWAEFKLGLGIFVLGVILVLAGARWWIWLQIPGVLCLLVGSVIAAKGYLGILFYRLTSHFKNVKPPAEFDKDK
jgi:NhaP-type Na+/H+ or K+/H+ antiporter